MIFTSISACFPSAMQLKLIILWNKKFKKKPFKVIFLWYREQFKSFYRWKNKFTSWIQMQKRKRDEKRSEKNAVHPCDTMMMMEVKKAEISQAWMCENQKLKEILTQSITETQKFWIKQKVVAKNCIMHTQTNAVFSSACLRKY